MSRILLIIHDEVASAKCAELLGGRHDLTSIRDLSPDSQVIAANWQPAHIILDEQNPDIVGLTALERVDKFSEFLKPLISVNSATETHYIKSPIDPQVIRSFSI